MLQVDHILWTVGQLRVTRGLFARLLWTSHGP